MLHTVQAYVTDSKHREHEEEEEEPAGKCLHRVLYRGKERLDVPREPEQAHKVKYDGDYD